MKKIIALLAVALAPMLAVAADQAAPQLKVEVAPAAAQEPQLKVEVAPAAQPVEAVEMMKKQKALWLEFQDKRLPTEMDLVKCVREADAVEKEQKCFAEIGAKLNEMQQKFMEEMMKLQPQPAVAAGQAPGVEVSVAPANAKQDAKVKASAKKAPKKAAQ